VDVPASERISRFIPHKNQVNRATGQVKADAFIPSKKVPLQKSVCCSSHYNDEQLWQIAEAHLGLSRTKTPEKQTLYGRADVEARIITNAGLNIDRDDQPFDGHANILGWPSDGKMQRELALLIAQGSRYVPVGGDPV